MANLMNFVLGFEKIWGLIALIKRANNGRHLIIIFALCLKLILLKFHYILKLKPLQTEL